MSLLLKYSDKWERLIYLFKIIVKTSSSHGQSGLERVEYLDGWRGLAIGLVLCSHFFPISKINIGRLGVDIFFVLSGLLMSNILFIKRVPLTIFYKRRISRIFPVFFVFISLLYACEYFFGSSSEYKNYLYSISFLRSYFPENSDIWKVSIPIGHIWSLNVEEHCYILLSFFAFFSFFKKREYIPLLFLGVGAILLQYIYVKYPEISSVNYELQTQVAASHLLLSSGYFLIKERFKRYVPQWLPTITFILSVYCYSNYAPWYSSWLISPFLLAFTVNHLDLVHGYIKNILSIDILRLLGMLSFSIYLWQQPFYMLHKYEVKCGTFFPYSNLILLFSSITMGAISFYFLEKPAREFLNNKW